MESHITELTLMDKYFSPTVRRNIEEKYYYIRDMRKKQEDFVENMPSKDSPADQFTKCLVVTIQNMGLMIC